jgi:MFS family permease
VLERDFQASSTAINVTVSVFMLTFAFGVSCPGIPHHQLDSPSPALVPFSLWHVLQPLFWSSFADWKGRRPLYLISIAVYVGANILLAAVPANYGALVFLRITQAFGSSAVVSTGAGSVADVQTSFRSEVWLRRFRDANFGRNARPPNQNSEHSSCQYFLSVPSVALFLQLT